ncbi:MAG: TetR/AcrR family transcriptional regulator [bacterium]|nr:TetR/AcrR family transcriptional regulator [bacterium]
MPKEKNVKEEILKKANGLFARYGYDKTTMDDIAEAVGKRKGALYYYFKTKEEVFTEVIEREISSLKNQVFESVRGEKTAKGMIKSYVLTRYKMLSRVASSYKTFREDYIRQFEFVQNLRRKFDLEEEKYIEAILTEGVRSGELKNLDISMTAESLVTAMKGFEYKWSNETNFKYVEKVIGTMLEIFFFGISREANK